MLGGVQLDAQSTCRVEYTIVISFRFFFLLQALAKKQGRFLVQ
jgi:hypothetical protein